MSKSLWVAPDEGWGTKPHDMKLPRIERNPSAKVSATHGVWRLFNGLKISQLRQEMGGFGVCPGENIENRCR
jgi:hypothetical protein